MKGEGEDTFASLLKSYEVLGASVRCSMSCADEEKMQPVGNVVSGSQEFQKNEFYETIKPKNKKVASENDPADQERMTIFWQMLTRIPSLTYRCAEGSIVDQPIRPVLDMSKIPFLYPTLEGFENRIIYYESSRGCPFSCSYCLSSVDKSVRFRDTELVKQELQYFLDRKVPQVKFVDRTFNCKKSHAMGIWQYLLEHDNGVTNFHFEIAADLLDEDELALMKKMRPGLIQLEIGVQSTNPATIEEIHRRMDLDRVKWVVEQVNAGHNIHQHLDLIVGLPYEDYDTFKKSFNEVYAMRPEQLQMGFLKVLKGSYMHEKVQDYDLVYRELPPYEVLSTKWLPYSDVLRLKGVEDALEVHYNSGQFACTLGLLEQDFADAFTMFEKIAEYYDRNGLNGRSHNRVARYEILHEFIREMLEAHQKNMIEQRNANASKSNENIIRIVGKEISVQIKPDESIKAAKQKPKELANEKDQITETNSNSLADYEDALITDMYLRENCKSRPSFALDQMEYKDRVKKLVPELRHLGAQVHVEVLRSGAIVMFDYREREPLTKNAKMTRLA
jgi:radical SAM superfamily enzyme YgiQ (UPF0313 family)